MVLRSMADQGPTTTRNLRLTPAPAARPEAEDQLSTELDAIITIGRALSHIPDAETRARVMRWAIERFSIDVTPTPTAEPGNDLELPANLMPAPQPDDAPAESLNVDGLGELFPPVDDSAFAAERDFTPPRDRARPKSSGDRLRDALHWMGI
jgi:hypothetical protein